MRLLNGRHTERADARGNVFLFPRMMSDISFKCNRGKYSDERFILPTQSVDTVERDSVTFPLRSDLISL